MNDEQLDVLIRRLDPEAQFQQNVRELTVEGRRLMVVSDKNADRMRVMTPIGKIEDLDVDVFERLLQANFDAVLDARYAIAQNIVWSVYIHPLSPLTEGEFFSGLAQVVVAAETFGTTFTSGALVFRGGDSENLHRSLYERILKKSRNKI